MCERRKFFDRGSSLKRMDRAVFRRNSGCVVGMLFSFMFTSVPVVVLLISLCQDMTAQNPNERPSNEVSDDDARIKELMGIASSLQRPPRTKEKLQKEIAQYDKILQINSNHQVVSTLRSQAQAKLEELEVAEQNERTNNQTLSEYQKYLSRGDLAGATTSLAVLKSRIPSDRRVIAAEQELTRVRRIHDLRLYGIWGFVLVVVGSGAGLWLWTARSHRQLVLVVISGCNLGQRVALKEGRTRVGSIQGTGAEHNDFVIDDPGGRVSRFQCFFELKNHRLFIVDDDSKNGTRVDGRPIHPGKMVPVQKGSQINLAGSCVMEVRSERTRD